MANRGDKIFGISITTLLLTGIVIVAILVGVGVIKVPLTEKMTANVCVVPVLTGASLLSGGKIRISFAEPINESCSKMLWEWGLDCSAPPSNCGGNGAPFTPVSGQPYIDVDAPPAGHNCQCYAQINLYPEGKQSDVGQVSNKVPVSVP